MRRALEVVYVTWIDSEAAAVWTDLAELDEEEHLLHAVGLLVHSDLNNYVLAVSYDPHLDAAIATLKIPRVCVKGMKTVATLPVRKNADK